MDAETTTLKTLCATISFLAAEHFETRRAFATFCNKLNLFMNITHTLPKFATANTLHAITAFYKDATKNASHNELTPVQISQRKSVTAQLRTELQGNVEYETIQFVQNALASFNHVAKDNPDSKEEFATAKIKCKTPKSTNVFLPYFPRLGCLLYLILDAVCVENVATLEIESFYKELVRKVAIRRRADQTQQALGFLLQGIIMTANVFKNRANVPLKPRLYKGTWYNYPLAGVNVIPRYLKMADLLLASHFLAVFKTRWDGFSKETSDPWNQELAAIGSGAQAWMLLSQPMWRSLQRQPHNHCTQSRKKRRGFEKTIAIAIAKPSHGAFGIEKTEIMKACVPASKPPSGSTLRYLFDAITSETLKSAATWANENMVQSFHASYLTEFTQQYAHNTMAPHQRAHLSTRLLHKFNSAFVSPQMAKSWKHAFLKKPSNQMRDTLAFYYNQLVPHKKTLTLGICGICNVQRAFTVLLCLHRHNVQSDNQTMILKQNTKKPPEKIGTDTVVQLHCPRTGANPNTILKVNDKLTFASNGQAHSQEPTCVESAYVTHVDPTMVSPMLLHSYKKGTVVVRTGAEKKHMPINPDLPSDIADYILAAAFATWTKKNSPLEIALKPLPKRKRSSAAAFV